MEVYPRGSFWFLVKTSMLCAGYIERRGGIKRREKKERLKNTPFRKKGRFQELKKKAAEGRRRKKKGRLKK